MSFRRNDQGRYGQVPPVRYPVANQQATNQNPERRSSFNTGDDSSYRSQAQSGASIPPTGTSSHTGDDELFMTSRTSPHRSTTGRLHQGSTSSALSGYHHQYQDPTPPTPSHATYNPQSFASTNSYQPMQSTTLPYHTLPNRSYSTATFPATSSSRTAHSPPQTYNPQSYNPAAYAAATPPQRHTTYAGYPTANQGYTYGDSGQGATTYGQSPGASYPPAAFSPSAHSPALSSGHGPSLNSPTYSNPAASPVYQPSQYNTAHQYSNYSANGHTQANAPAGPYSNSTQTPYPTTSHMPVGPHYSAGDDDSHYYNRQSRSGSQVSPSASPYMQAQSSPGLQRHPTNAPLPRRPVDQRPLDVGQDMASDNRYDLEPIATQESLMQEIFSGLSGSGAASRSNSGGGSANEGASSAGVNRYNSTATTAMTSVSRSSSGKANQYHGYDEEDAIGEAGVQAMLDAEEEYRRFSGATFTSSNPVPVSNPLPPPPEEQPLDDDDSDVGGGNVDLSMLSGGYAGNLTYGMDIGSSPDPLSDATDSRPQPTTPGYFAPPLQDMYANSSGFENAEVDYAGTGGLQHPTVHRLSFDEGREDRMSIHSRQSGTESPVKDGYQDLFFHPGLSSRPLPALPLAGQTPGSDSSSMTSVNMHSRGSFHAPSTLSVDSRYPRPGPDSSENYYQSQHALLQQPERSISLSGHSNTPQVVAPARSRTDAAEERKKLGRYQQGLGQQPTGIAENESSTPLGAFDGITLPSGRKRKFVPSKLNSSDFKRCVEPWALSGIVAWLREMAEGEMDLKDKTIEEALIYLFTFKVTKMNVADAEALSQRVVSLMRQSSILIPDEEWVKFGQGQLSGVLWQLTGTGCYAPKLHDPEISGRCYSYHCTRTLKKIDLSGIDATTRNDEWHIFYNLKKEDWESRDKKEVDRQNMLHEIVTGEENYINTLDTFRKIYRDELRATNPPIISPERREKFLNNVFGKLDAVIGINKEHLFAQLKYRQQEQGPWIVGFSDIFREWIRKAKSDYIEYATGYPRAAWMVRKEAERNVYFKKFLEEQQKHKSSSRQDWTHFLIAPIQRLPRYTLLLENVDQKMREESEEKTNLGKAINEIKAVTLECDAKVAETNKRVQMMELNRMLVLRPGFQSVLNLDHLGRELIIQGDLTRIGSKGVRWVDTHALLFDHYLILAKEVNVKDGRGEKKYDVSREPIPMPLLFLESMNDEPVIRQKGITAPLGRTTAAASGSQLNKVASNNSGRPVLEHAPTSSSIGSNPAPGTSNEESKILYPFRIKHLGYDVYTLYASSSQDRLDWGTKIVEAKTRHARALFQQNAEPFRLRVLADASFSYDTGSLYSRTAGVPVKGTPLDRAIEDIEGILGSAQGIAPVCRAQVNCATGFSAFGKQVIAIGTDYGVFISEPSNPRGWTRTIQAARITQIAVLEEFSVCILISDKSLISYPLETVAPISDYAAATSDSARKAPQRLAKDVTYFATARMKDRTLVFYKRRENLHTTFKVLEPILQKATEKKSRFRRAGGGNTDTFRDYDEFFFPTECYSLSLFQTYIAVATSKGVEMLTLDKKNPVSIPDLKQPAIANIANRIKDQRPLGMFRLNENEFLLTYEDCAVYVDKHGDVSRTLIMEYTGKQKKARGATMYGQYLLLFNDDYVEVRNAENGRLRQIIAGRDVRLIDYGVRGPTGGNAQQTQSHYGTNGLNPQATDASKATVKLAMSHPELSGRQVVLEMLPHDGHMEN